MVDEEWDSIWKTFNEDVDSLKALEKRFVAIAPAWKKWAKRLREESEGIREFFASAECPEDLRRCSEGYSDSMHKLSRAVWPNVEEKYVGSVLEPLRRTFEEEIPAIREIAKQRAGILTDVNSYRRKLQKLLSNDRADPERKQVVKAKLDKAVASFETIDMQLKTRLKKFHHERFERVRPYANVFFFSQLDVLNRACALMSMTTDHIPADDKKSTMGSLAHMHSTRGVRPMSVMPPRKTTGGFWSGGSGQKRTSGTATGGRKNKFLDDVTGRGGGRDLSNNKTPQIDADHLPPTPAVDATVSINDDDDDDVRSGQDEEKHEEEDNTNDPIDSNNDAKVEDENDEFEYVVADFDFTSDDAGDLPFKKGDRIKVLSKDGGWWKGEMGDNMGMFPANYTHLA